MLDEPKKRYSRKREQRKIKFDILNAFADKLNLPHTWEWSRSPEIEPPNFLSTEDVRRFYERACPEPYDDKEKLKELKKAIKNDEPKKIVKDRFTVAEKIISIRNFAKEHKRFEFEELFADDMTKSELINVFLAVLELLKLQTIKVLQSGTFGNIVITSNEV